MRKFRFKFATVLKARQTREEDVLRQLGAAQRALQAELASKNKLLNDLDSSLVRRENLGQVPVGILAFQMEQQNILGIKHRITRADQAIIRAKRSVEKALRAYLIARRQTRMMELLYENHYAEFKKERARKEQREVDDLVVMRSHLAREEEEIAS